MNPLPSPASRLWEASIRKLKYSTILRGSVVPSGGTFDGPAAATGNAAGGDPITLTPSLSVSSSTSNTIYQYDDGDEDIDSVLDDVDTDDDDVDEASLGEPSHSDQLLPSGDFYQGDLRGDLPHGAGKYLWTDGSMYEGSWRGGRGKFSWSSGAIYEGDLAGGYMHGQGTYIGELGDTFAGLWANNLRHGRGTQAYVNGDVYDGHWRDGLQDGHGQYIWRGGHEYIGTWKAGEMHGRGTVIWADDDRYDGAWEDAKPKGQGTFRWSDGGMYIGLWCQESGETQGKGVYYPPSGGPAVPLPREPKEVITKLLEELEMSEGKTVSLLPSQKVLTWPGVEPVTKKPVWRPPEVAADQGMWRPPEVGPDQGRRSSRRNNMSSDIDSLVEGEDGGEESRNDRSWVRTPSCMRAPTLPKPGKKQGETISKGHKNYELMLNLQLGIILDVPIMTHFSAERTMSLRGGGESAGSDSPCRREEAKSRTPRPQPGSAGERSAAASAEMSSGSKSCGGDSLQPGEAGEHGVAPSAAAVETSSEVAKVRGQAATPYSAAPFDESMLVQHSTGKAMGNREADVAAVGLGPKNSGLKICPARSLVSNLFLFL
uniref:Hypothetical_protein n=1 Tax=Oryza glaberrima TaxID=4538 RepID=G2XMY1_ORYGL|nr:hypothetical_protein [Oryza glaberrima]